MAGIFPDGGVVWNRATNSINIDAANLDTNCDALFFRNRCKPEFNVAWANAITSELFNLMLAYCPAHVYDCSVTNNLATALATCAVQATAVDDSATTAQDQTVSLTPLTNDQDADGYVICEINGGVIATGSPFSVADGTVQLTADERTLLFTPSTGFVGTTSFTYTICDTAGNTSTATINIEVVAAQLLAEVRIGTTWNTQNLGWDNMTAIDNADLQAIQDGLTNQGSAQCMEYVENNLGHFAWRFTTPQTVDTVTVYPSTDRGHSSGFVQPTNGLNVWGSNDGINWTNILNSSAGTNTTPYVADTDNAQAWEFIRAVTNFTSNFSLNYVAEIEITN